MQLENKCKLRARSAYNTKAHTFGLRFGFLQLHIELGECVFSFFFDTGAKI